MESVFDMLPLSVWALSVSVALLAGLVKGMVGFALPMIMISGLGSSMSPELALAGLILPTVFTNSVQAFRLGLGSARQAVHRFRWFLLAGGVFLILGAQLVPILSERVFLLVLGGPVVLFALAQLAGWQLAHRKQTVKLDISFGFLAGLIGGMSGIWGPPTVSYLTALNTPKTIQFQIQGVIYFLGSILLTAAHVAAGILTRQTAVFSLLLVIPAMIGLFAGMYVHDRIDQKTFRRATLVVLLIAGLNLVRRGVLV
jgi:uncharacterized membrane protein YfcA